MQTSPMNLAASGSSSLFGSSESGGEFSVQVTWPASAAGSFVLMATNENVGVGLPVGTAPTWTQVGPIATADGVNPGSVLVQFSFPAGKYRVDYARTSGNGTAYVSPCFARTR